MIGYWRSIAFVADQVCKGRALQLSRTPVTWAFALVGASLLAIAAGQSTLMLNVPLSSRAGSLPQRCLEQGTNDPLMVIWTLNLAVFFTLISDTPNKQRPPGMARVLLKLSAIKETLIPLDPQESS
jgi:hypothetical protein